MRSVPGAVEPAGPPSLPPAHSPDAFVPSRMSKSPASRPTTSPGSRAADGYTAGPSALAMTRSLSDGTVSARVKAFEAAQSADFAGNADTPRKKPLGPTSGVRSVQQTEVNAGREICGMLNRVNAASSMAARFSDATTPCSTSNSDLANSNPVSILSPSNGAPTSAHCSNAPNPATSTPRSLSSAALAALADSPARPRPPLPPKSSARPSRTSTYSLRSRSSSNAGTPLEGSTTGSAGHSRPQSIVIDESALHSVQRTRSSTGVSDNFLAGSTVATGGSSLSHTRPRPPSRSQASSRTNSSVYTPSTGAMRSSGFISSSEDGGMMTSGETSWLGTPASTADYSSTAEASPYMDPTVPSKRQQQHVHPQHFDQPTSAFRREAGSSTPPIPLEGLGIAYDSAGLAGPPLTGSRSSFDGEGEFAHDLARLSAFAQSLPSPLPGMTMRDTGDASSAMPWSNRQQVSLSPTQSRPGRPAVQAQPSSSVDDRTLVVFPDHEGPRATAAHLARVPAPPPLLPVFAPRTREPSAQSTWTTSSSISAPRPSLLHIPAGSTRSGPGLRTQSSLDQLASPATEGSEAYYPSHGEETNFLSTDIDADVDGDEDDEDDSYGLALGDRVGAGTRRASERRFRAFGKPLSAESSFATSASDSPGPLLQFGLGSGVAGTTLSNGRSRGNSLWSEDAPAWTFGEGPAALGHTGIDSQLRLSYGADTTEEDVLDWSDSVIEKKELPANTTHLLLRRCKTPLQIAPLLTHAVPMLAHGLVVLDISDCGLSEVPSAIASCCFLEELSITGNPLATGTLPSFLGTLPALNVLLADSCDLTSLPSSLVQLCRLHTLAVRSNRLRTLPAWLARLEALETLLIDNNPFHWQVQDVVRPLFVSPTAETEADLATPLPRHGSPLPPLPPHESASALATPGSNRNSPLPGPPPPIDTTVASPPVASPPSFHSVAGTPIFAVFSTPPLGASSAAPSAPELAAALESVHAADLRSWDASSGSFPALTPALTPSLTPALTPALTSAVIDALPGSTLALPTSLVAPPVSEASEKKDKRKWGRLLKKVSSTRLRSGSKPPPPPSLPFRPGALDAETRTFSQPVTRSEGVEAEGKAVNASEEGPGIGGGASSGSRMFGSVGRKLKKRSKDPGVVAAALALHGPRAAPPTKRRSFLLLDAFPPFTPLSLATPPPPLSGTTVLPQGYPAALRSVLAYLRDLDDLSPEVSLPTIPLDAPSSPLRHSPSLGTLGAQPGGSPAASQSATAVCRAQSTRRLPSYGSGSSSAVRPPTASLRTSQAYDEAPDVAPGRPTTPSPVAAAAISEGKKATDDPIKREAVLKEIIETEQTYLRSLEELCGIYVDSASIPVSSSANGGRRDTVLPSVERRAVFGNIEAIRDFHRRVLLPDLLAAVRGGGDSTVVAGKVGDVFIQHASFMKIYTSYINSFDDALARIQTWAKASARSRSNTASGTPNASPAIGSSTMFDATAGVASTLSSSQKKRIKSWLKRARAHPSHSQISLESYLLLPIQRIPRYRLLLETLLSCTPPPTVPPDPSTLAALLDPHVQIAQAVREMDEVAVALNESKRENEGRAQLVMWQNRIASKFKSPLVQPHRTLLRSGNLTLVRSVKRSTAPVEPPLPNLHYAVSGSPAVDPIEIPILFQETKQIHLIGLLCTDLLVLVKAPGPPLDQDPTAPVELYTVLRLNSPQGVLGSPAGRSDSPASLFGSSGDIIRLRVGDKAVCYLCVRGADPAKNRREALQWVNAINLQFEVNT